MIHKCNNCEYQTPYKANYMRHVKNKHNIYKAPTNTLQPEVAYTSREIPQHLTGYQVRQGLPHQSGSGVLHTTQQ